MNKTIIHKGMLLVGLRGKEKIKYTFRLPVSFYSINIYEASRILRQAIYFSLLDGPN